LSDKELSEEDDKEDEDEEGILSVLKFPSLVDRVLFEGFFFRLDFGKIGCWPGRRTLPLGRLDDEIMVTKSPQ
jgi:hypothetical protein